jgi:hypothetical protein
MSLPLVDRGTRRRYDGIVVYDGPSLPRNYANTSLNIDPICVLWFDPGGTTGVAKFLRRGAKTVITCWERPWLPGDFWDFLWDQHEKQIPMYLGHENFKASPQTDHTALKVIGGIEIFADIQRIELCAEEPANIQGAAALVPERYQKALDLWMPGATHANDALRHIIWWLIVRRRERDWLVRKPKSTRLSGGHKQ